ncbi:MAG: hypothetical protein GX633_01695 [Clostridiales bacterium]|nr:hypothetical protein [Clostridiales bacterium]
MGTIKIGWAERDVTPSGPHFIPGHFNMRISVGVMDPITTTALVVDSGDDMAIFLSIDCVVIRCFLLDEIRGRVAKINPEIPVMKILANATHTHEAPSHYYDGGELSEYIKDQYTDEQLKAMLASYIPNSYMDVPRPGMEIESSDKYREFLAQSASEAICEAYEKRAEGGIGYGYGYAIVARSRRTVYFDDYSKRPDVELNSLTAVHGHAVMYGNTNDDNFSHFEAGDDPFINIMFTFDAADKLTGAIINIPCPSQASESQCYLNLTADYWHDIKREIRAKYGDDIKILGQCAAGGDLSPHQQYYLDARVHKFTLKYDKTSEELKGNCENIERLEIGERVAWAFDEVLSWAKKDIKKDVKLAHVVETVELSKRMITDEEYEYSLQQLEELAKEDYRYDLETARHNLNNNSVLKSKRNRFSKIIDRYKNQKTEKKFPMEMHVIRIGDIAFASNRFELYMDYMHRIQARSPFEQTFIVQIAGQPGMEGGSYLCTERAREGRGYSASMFCNLVSCEGGQEMVNRTLDILNELAD